ncbi:MAG: hypothetical protein PVF37_03725 [Desulfobacterales bacterium]
MPFKTARFASYYDTMTKSKLTQKTPYGSGHSEKAINVFDSLLGDTGQKKITDHQINVILDALANAGDVGIVARFPAVLSICARRGLSLNYQSLFSRYWETSPKRQNLEKLLLACAMIFKRLGLQPPNNLVEITASFSAKYEGLLKEGRFQLSNGLYVSMQVLQDALSDYARDCLTSKVGLDKQPSRSVSSLDIYLDRIFPTKQKELVKKKRDGARLTKTEREYFSRIVRKKLEAIANEEVVRLARELTRHD